jgi:predicted restriction endonuclease
VRDKGCRFPGCDRPPHWTDGHHIKHSADGGRTEVANLLSMCRRHHRFVHEKGWMVGVDEVGNPVITPPP